MLNEYDGNEKLNIILIHGVVSSDSITDLLFRSKSKLLAELSNPAFEDACGIIKNKFASQIHSIRKEVFSGTNQNAFNNHMEAWDVEDAYVPNNYEPISGSKKSWNLIPFIRKSPVNVVEIRVASESPVPEKGSAAEIFSNQIIA